MHLLTNRKIGASGEAPSSKREISNLSLLLGYLFQPFGKV